MREIFKIVQFIFVNVLIYEFFVLVYWYIFFIFLFSYFCSLMSYFFILESVKVLDSYFDFVFFNL